MTNYKTHLFFGYVVAVAIVFMYSNYVGLWPSPGEIILLFSVASAYSIFPDIDHRMSAIRFIFLLLTFLYLLILGIAWYLQLYRPKIEHIMFSIVGLAFIGIIVLLTKHRGAFHHPMTGLIFSLPLLYYGWFPAAIGLSSYSSHLFLDKITRG